MPGFRGCDKNVGDSGRDPPSEEGERERPQQQMLAPLCCPFPLEPPLSILPLHAFADIIPITTKRLQLLSYVLAEISSAATLLDDYVRANMNISHRLLAAWQSIAVAAQARRASQAKKDGAPRKGWCSIGRGGSPASNAVSEASHDGSFSRPHVQHADGRSLARFHAYHTREDTAARHVEFIRRAVVTGLFQQYLDVSVTESMDDLVLHDWLGPEFVQHSRGRDRRCRCRCRRRRYCHRHRHRHHHSHAYHDAQSRLHKQESNGSRFTDLTDGEGGDHSDHKREVRESCQRESGNNTNEGRQKTVPCQGQQLQTAKLSAGMGLMRPTSVLRDANNDDDEEDEDEYARAAVHLQVFIRAAVAFNPTLCALQLMSRCVLRAKNVRNVDDEAGVVDGMVNSEEDLFFVVVASRAVGRCEHTESCFGNRKFFFVRCHDSVLLRRGGDVSDASRVAESAALTAPLSLEALTGPGGTREAQDTVSESNRVWSRTMQTLTQRLPELHRTNAVVHVRDSTHPLGRVLSNGFPPLSSNLRTRRGQNDHTESLHGANEDNRTKRGIKRGSTCDCGMKESPPFKQQQQQKEGGEEDEDEENKLHSWFVMHSNRCSTTGLFFATPSPRLDRLISISENSMQGTSLVRELPCGADDMCVTLDQAIFVPPNAGHDSRHRADNSRKQSTAGTAAAAAAPLYGASRARAEPVSVGQLAFLEELISRLNFWSARGGPQRRYYDPTLAGGCQASGEQQMTDATPDASEGFSAPRATRSKSGIVLPLKLLFTQVGTIEFHQMETSMYKNGSGQRLLLLALSESTELVICSTRESRPHCCWHDQGRRGCRRCCENSRRDGRIFSGEEKDPFSWGCHEDIATEAVVRWAQGEVRRDDKKGSFSFSVADDHSRPPTTAHHLQKRRTLSKREQRQLQNERLKIEFRLANSERLEALLVDQRSAKPIASLVLCQSPWGERRMDGDQQVMPCTTFFVQSFSHYVAGILRHLRQEKVFMVDMDRTLVDNAIIPAVSLDSADGSTTNSWHSEREALELHCEAWKEVCYSHWNGSSQSTYEEVIYVRCGVREMLRRFSVEWGIPLVLVTKSSMRRTEAILRQLLDPDGALFPPGCGRIYTAELMMHASSEVSSSVGHTAPTSVEGTTDTLYGRQCHQQGLINVTKSIAAVLHELDRVSKQLADLHPSPFRARSVVVLDDAPQVWKEVDWSRTVWVDPYTLDRIDPEDYFTSDGLIPSMLLSTLYSHRSVVCPVPNCRMRMDNCCAAMKQDRAGDCELFDENSNATSCDTTTDDDDMDDEVGGSLIEICRAPTPCFSAEGIVDEDDAVVEETAACNGGACWATADVEDVIPL